MVNKHQGIQGNCQQKQIWAIATSSFVIIYFKIILNKEKFNLFSQMEEKILADTEL